MKDDSPNALWNNLARRTGHWKIEAKINLLDIKDWWIDRRRIKRVLYRYIYECGCTPGAAHLSTPFCPIHGLRLVRKKIKVKKDVTSNNNNKNKS